MEKGFNLKQEREKLLDRIEKLINSYIRKELKTTASIEKEWKLEELENKKTKLGIHRPRIYSNQYFAFIELRKFWKELKKELKDMEVEK